MAIVCQRPILLSAMLAWAYSVITGVIDVIPNSVDFWTIVENLSPLAMAWKILMVMFDSLFFIFLAVIATIVCLALASVISA